ncbi:Omp28-related outer membrane protein [Flavobacterium sp.]|uniref:Omp28-related outer membrane protein n=1 Tax=Flavobacterium sp. TaxID=239 RepID=UPI0026399D91|nr:Omp28-related outer membrane protein [Flavobacterium sp.]
MKKSGFLGLLSITLFLASCSSTEMVYSPIPVDDTVDAPPISGLFQKKVLIEDYTGTWCGNCTRVSLAINKVEAETDNMVAVAIHNGNDPYHFAGYQPLQELVSPGRDLELPVSRLNRITRWTTFENDHINEALNLTSNNCGLGLAMKTVVGDATIDLDVKVKFAQNYDNLRLVVYVLENHLIYRQTNYYSFCGTLPTIQNFDHNHVLRASLTDLLGNPLANTNFNQTVTTHFSVPIPSNISNPDNISFVAFVVDANNNALNARAAEGNEDQDFEQNP